MLGAIGVTPGETAPLQRMLHSPAVQTATPASCAVEMRSFDSASKRLAVLRKVLPRPNETVYVDLPGNLAYMWQPMRGNGALAETRFNLNPAVGAAVSGPTN